jgi:hypothetical protein
VPSYCCCSSIWAHRRAHLSLAIPNWTRNVLCPIWTDELDGGGDDADGVVGCENCVGGEDDDADAEHGDCDDTHGADDCSRLGRWELAVASGCICPIPTRPSSVYLFVFDVTTTTMVADVYQLTAAAAASLKSTRTTTYSGSCILNESSSCLLSVFPRTLSPYGAAAAADGPWPCYLYLK